MHGRIVLTVLAVSWTVQNIAVPRDPYQIRTLCTPYPINIGRRVSVSNGAELQKALDTAAAGDIVLLAPGVTYRPDAAAGSFVLRNRSIPANQWVIVRSASAAFEAEGSVPPNTRVAATNAGDMPQIRARANNAAAMVTEPGARGYRLVGLDIGADSSVGHLANLVDLQTDSSDIVIDRCYLHGNDSGNFRRGVMMNGARLAVIESYIENFHDGNTDSQAVGGYNGPGPFKIVNNFLEAASENIMFGGGDPTVANLVPSDIEVRRNLSTKRLSWRTSGVPAKNAFELKNARRVLVEGNIFERVWTSGQDGTAIVLKSANQDGACPWCVTEYVIFRNNIVRGAAHGMLINAAETGRPGLPMPVKVNHIIVENVLFEDIGGPQWKGGKLFRVFGGVADLAFTHITSRSNPIGILDPRDPDDANPRLVFTNNIVERRYYGIGSGTVEGEQTLARNFPSFVYDRNVVVNTSAPTDQAIDHSRLEGRYPSRTWVVDDWDAVGFEGDSSTLSSRSRFHNAASDGKDVGVDMAAISAAQNGPGGSASCSPVPGRRRPAFVARAWSQESGVRPWR
jgi:hypothetical protein